MTEPTQADMQKAMKLIAHGARRGDVYKSKPHADFAQALTDARQKGETTMQERCAKVIENHPSYEMLHDILAAAIRELK